MFRKSSWRQQQYPVRWNSSSVFQHHLKLFQRCSFGQSREHAWKPWQEKTGWEKGCWFDWVEGEIWRLSHKRIDIQFFMPVKSRGDLISCTLFFDAFTWELISLITLVNSKGSFSLWLNMIESTYQVKRVYRMKSFWFAVYTLLLGREGCRTCSGLLNRKLLLILASYYSELWMGSHGADGQSGNNLKTRHKAKDF